MLKRVRGCAAARGQAPPSAGRLLLHRCGSPAAFAKGRNRQQLRETRGDFTWCRPASPSEEGTVDPLRRLVVQ